jgi:hypothetical protein
MDTVDTYVRTKIPVAATMASAIAILRSLEYVSPCTIERVPVELYGDIIIYVSTSKPAARRAEFLIDLI